MTKKLLGVLILLPVLAGCQTAGGFIPDLPQQVQALAAPNQNLSAVRLLEEDNCYWYRHDGVVESTMLPLRSTRGRHICAQTPQ